MKKVKVLCSKVTHNPYVETLVTEINERVFTIVGYEVGDRLLEDVLFDISFNEDGSIIDVVVQPDSKDYFEDLNTKKWYKEVRKRAEEILLTGDEVEIPNIIKNKYFKKGINVVYITVE